MMLSCRNLRLSPITVLKIDLKTELSRQNAWRFVCLFVDISANLSECGCNSDANMV